MPVLASGNDIFDELEGLVYSIDERKERECVCVYVCVRVYCACPRISGCRMCFEAVGGTDLSSECSLR